MDAGRKRVAWQQGLQAEAHVAQLLVAQGWTVLARNWRGEGGELDIVVERDGVLRFVEVRARDEDDPTGADSIDEGKQRHLIAAAEEFLEQHPVKREAAFLVALVTLGTPPDVEWIDDAFDG